jgi:hypothetical protein
MLRPGKEKAVKTIRQKYYTSKQLRLSVAVMVLWSFLAVGILNFLTIEFSKKINPSFSQMGYNLLIISLIFIAYLSVLFLFIMRFSNRFIGPFERLKREIGAFTDGNYKQRLMVRDNDDMYIRSFVDAVNSALNSYEQTYLAKENMLMTVDREIIALLSAIEREDFLKEDQSRALLRFCEKVKNSGA